MNALESAGNKVIIDHPLWRGRKMKVKVLLNAAAGNGPETWARLGTHFKRFGIEADMLDTRNADIAALARTAIASSPDAVIAGGGDGTVSAVASSLAHTGVKLGVLPLGTLNHFAKDLGIPSEIEGAIELVATGAVRDIDLGEVNGRLFINNSSIGVYPRLVRHREEQRLHLGIGKWPALLIAAFKVFRRFPDFRVEMVSEGVKVSRRTPFVFVGNNEYAIDLFTIRNRKALDQGVLNVYTANRGGRYEMMRLFVRALTGRLDQGRDFTTFTLPGLVISTRRRRPATVALDGELVKISPPLVYKSRPGALRIIAPQPSRAPESEN